MQRVFSATVLGRYEVKYYFSEESGLLQTESPYWLDEAYESAIAATDTGLVRRNISNCRNLRTLFPLLGPTDPTIVDLGGGYGLLTRLLRDEGYNCLTSDPMCSNLFATSFEPDEDTRADLLLAFEVFEHIPNPLEFVRENFRRYKCRNLILSTLPFCGKIPEVNWWYYSFETGQHITFYQTRSLALIADQLGCFYFHIAPDLHLITEMPLPWIWRFVLYQRHLRRIAQRFTKSRQGLTWPDHHRAKENIAAKTPNRPS
jgi:SAM-dependent methyltransferase